MIYLVHSGRPTIYPTCKPTLFQGKQPRKPSRSGNAMARERQAIARQFGCVTALEVLQALLNLRRAQELNYRLSDLRYQAAIKAGRNKIPTLLSQASVGRFTLQDVYGCFNLHRGRKHGLTRQNLQDAIQCLVDADLLTQPVKTEPVYFLYDANLSKVEAVLHH